MSALTSHVLAVAIETPFISHGSTAAAYGLDAVLARNAADRPILPGSLILGNLRHAWSAWGDLGKEYRAYLGQSSGDELPKSTRNFQPFRKSLLIDDLELEQALAQAPTAQLLTRIRLDAATGAAAQGALLVAEQAALPGAQLRFKGRVRLPAGDAGERLKRAIAAGLEWAGQLGAEKAVGYGRVLAVEWVPHETPSAAHELDPADEFALILKFQSPFCVPEKSLGKNNLFEGRNVVPGAVLKGALATSWAALLGKTEKQALTMPITADFDATRPTLCRHFDTLIFRHAFPLNQAGERALSLPLSLVKWGGQFLDVASWDGPDAKTGTSEAYESPAFAVDWKSPDFGQVLPALGWPDLQKETRVRTHINPKTGRPEDEKLFAHEAVIPGAERWGFNVSLPAIAQAERSALRQELQSLLQALGWEIGWIGKTKTFADVSPQAALATAHIAKPNKAWAPGQPLRLQLQTDALIGDWRALTESAGAKQLAELYRSAFHDLSGGALAYVRHFARQKLLGGRYLHGRHRADQVYRPWLLTEAGSVFVLNIVDAAKAEPLLRQWQAGGLPLPQWIVDEAAGRPLWQSVPYLPQAGYGEIVLNPNLDQLGTTGEPS